MPFKARTELGQEILAFEQQGRPQNNLSCPHCNKEVVSVWDNTTVCNHFRHKNTHCPYETEPESVAHLTGKKILYDLIKRTNPQLNPQLEHRVGNRIADVYFKTPTYEFIFEFQHTKITPVELLQRCNDYTSQGIYSLWFLDAATNRIRGDYDTEQIISVLNHRGSPLVNQTRILQKNTAYFLDWEQQKLIVSQTSWNNVGGKYLAIREATCISLSTAKLNMLMPKITNYGGLYTTRTKIYRNCSQATENNNNKYIELKINNTA